MLICRFSMSAHHLPDRPFAIEILTQGENLSDQAMEAAPSLLANCPVAGDAATVPLRELVSLETP
jgi:hypothetical protein